MNVRVEALRAPHRDALVAERRKAFDEPTAAALKTPPGERSEAQKALAEKAEMALKPKTEEIDARLSADEKSARAEVEARVKELERERPAPLPLALGLTDQGPKAEPTRLLVRGDAHKPGAEVAPGFLSVLDRETADD